MKGMTVAD